MTQEQTSLTVGQPYVAGQNYDQFQAQVQATFERNYSKYGPVLLRANGRGLSTMFLEMLNEADGTRQHHNCDCCRNFIREYGNAYFIDDQGNQIAAMWEVNGDLPAEYHDAVAALKQRIETQPGSYLLASFDDVLGRAVSGGWNHLHVKTPTTLAALAAGRYEHAIRRDSKYQYGEFMKALTKATVANYRELARLFEGGLLEDRANYAQWSMWLLKLAVLNFESDLSQQQKRNLTMAVLATSPRPWLTFRSGVIGEVLDGILTGKSFEAIKRRHVEITAPTKYQRPQAAPSVGNIEAAEKLIADLGLTTALQRRPATWDEVKQYGLWVAPAGAFAEATDATDSVFGALRNKVAEAKDAPMKTPAVEITWVRFIDEVLPKAKSIDIKLRDGAQFGGIMGPVDPEAGRLFFYETDEKRNPFSWYIHNGLLAVGAYGLKPGRHRVLGMLRVPALWQGDVPGADRFKPQCQLVIKDCESTSNLGVNLFPELMRNELHSIRGTIEAYSQTTKAADAPVGQKAQGVYIAPGIELVVTTELGELGYIISGYH